MSEVEEDTKTFRLRYLIRDCGYRIFRYRVEETVKPQTIETFIQDIGNKEKLGILQEKHIITKKQYELLYPDSGTPSAEDFDISLWLVILRTFCCSRPCGDPIWYKGSKPIVNDLSLEADLVRIRDHISEVEDAKGLELTDESFKEKWEDLSQIVLRVGSGIDGLERRIKQIKDMEFDATENDAVETDFITWKKMEREFEPGLDLSMGESKVFRLRLYLLLVDGGTRVFRHILDDRLPPSSLEVAIIKNTSTIKYLEGKGVINASQHKLLYPGTGPPLSESFDITLLTVLLRNFCGFNSKLPVWNSKGQPPVTDTSPEADIVRIREHRNEIFHLPKTRGLTKEDFEKIWEEVNQNDLKPARFRQTVRETLLRLDSICSKTLPNLQEEIDELKRNTIDPKREEELLRVIHEWIKMDKEYESKIIDCILKHSASERSKETVRDVLDEKYFVRTEQFEKAKTKLLENNIIVLNGAPGEGKTTVAKKLLVEVTKNERYIQLNTYSDWEFVILDNVQAVLIDDMFGSGIFDKEESRKWQKHIPSIAAAVKSKHLYVIITSRSYILTEAVDKMIVESIFTPENIVTLSSKHLLPNERKTILDKHFEKACHRNEQIRELVSQNKHAELIKDIVELELESPDASSTIGFPECARLLANNAGLYQEGVAFFKSPMARVKSYISCLLNDDDTFVALFVLWAQNTRTLSSLELERSIQETSDTITDPICKLQFRPKDHIRKIRQILQQHRGGFIHFDSKQEVFSFSHRVVQDSIGIVSFEKNTTAAIAFCDTTFIENFIRIGNRPYDSSETRQEITTGGLDREESCPETLQQKYVSLAKNESFVLPECVVILSQARYAQLSLQIGKLVISPAFKTNDFSLSPSKKPAKVSRYLDPSLFKHNVFNDRAFCKTFFDVMQDRNWLQAILNIPVRTLDREFAEFKFLKIPNTEIRLASYLVWIKESICPLSDMCFDVICSADDRVSKQELSMAMLISTKLGDCSLVKHHLRKGAEININTMSLALATKNEEMFALYLDKTGVVNDETTLIYKMCEAGYSEMVLALLKRGVDIEQINSSGVSPIHVAIARGHLETANVLLDYDESQAAIEYNSSTDKLSLFHFATHHQKLNIINGLLERGIRPTKLDAMGRTPFLYAICHNKTDVVHRLLETAIEDDMQSLPDKNDNTPLYVAVKKMVEYKAKREDRKVFERLALKLCKFEDNLHLVNTSGYIPLTFACQNELTVIVNEILKHEDPYKNKGSTIFHHFVTTGDLDSIETLLKSNIDPNITDEYHRTPSMLANVLRKRNVIRRLQRDQRISKYNMEMGIGIFDVSIGVPAFREGNTGDDSSSFESYSYRDSYKRERRPRRGHLSDYEDSEDYEDYVVAD